MGAAIWSCSIETILSFPARTFIQFFHNHGLLGVFGQPQWYTVTGGSRAYVEKLTAGFVGKIRVNCGAAKVSRSGDKVQVTDEHGDTQDYDRIVFACHADQALRLLQDEDAQEREILGAFSFQENRIIVHGDESFMPRTKGCWSSWVYLSEGAEDKNPVVSLSYWMNNLQNLDCKPVFITLNPGRRPDESLIYDEHVFSHPVFTQVAIEAQGRIGDLQGQRNTYYCGAWQRYGFHEDGLLSAVQAVRKMGVEASWL